MFKKSILFLLLSLILISKPIHADQRYTAQAAPNNDSFELCAEADIDDSDLPINIIF